MILRIENRLIDDDRARLRFFLQDDVTQRYKSDLSLIGTVNLFDSLITQDIINKNDVNFLINAFDTIRCFDAAKILKAYQERTQSNTIHQSLQSLSSIMPPMIDPVRNKHPINTNININDIFDEVDHASVNNETRLSSQQQRKSLFNINFMTYKCLPGRIVLLMLAIGLLSGFIAIYNNRIQGLTTKVTTRVVGMSTIVKKYNTTLKSQTSEYRNDVTTSNKQLVRLPDNKEPPIIKIGKIFGGIDGIPFLDSKISKFTFYHYVSGIIISHNEKNNYLQSIQFLYKSIYDYQNNIKSKLHGNYGYKSHNITTFILNNDEKIYKIQGQITNMLQIDGNHSRYQKTWIKRIRFFTTQDRIIPSYKEEDDDDKTFVEEFDGYTLGYVGGGSSQYIDGLKFYWYQTE